MKSLVLAFALAGCVTVPRDCRVVDGDTMVCDRERIRLNGIDAPEMGTIGGEVSKRALERITKGREIIITRRFKEDRYGRTVASAKADGADLSCLMVTSGYARYVAKWDEEKSLWRDCISKGVASYIGA